MPLVFVAYYDIHLIATNITLCVGDIKASNCGTYITDIPQFAVVYQNIPQLQSYIPQLPYTACLALMRLRSA